MFASACVWTCVLFFFKQKTAYELRISDWSSDVCSSYLASLWRAHGIDHREKQDGPETRRNRARRAPRPLPPMDARTVARRDHAPIQVRRFRTGLRLHGERRDEAEGLRSEEHTSELQSLMRISYAVFCLNKKKTTPNIINTTY